MNAVTSGPSNWSFMFFFYVNDIQISYTVLAMFFGNVLRLMQGKERQVFISEKKNRHY